MINIYKNNSLLLRINHVKIVVKIAGENRHLPLLFKLCSKKPMFWNYLSKCLYFLKLILTKSSYRWNLTLAMVSSIHILSHKFFWKFKWNLTLLMSSFTCNLILLKLSLKNMDILLNNFKIGTFYCIVCKLWANAYFSQKLWHKVVGLEEL